MHSEKYVLMFFRRRLNEMNKSSPKEMAMCLSSIRNGGSGSLLFYFFNGPAILTQRSSQPPFQQWGSGAPRLGAFFTPEGAPSPFLAAA